MKKSYLRLLVLFLFLAALSQSSYAASVTQKPVENALTLSSAPKNRAMTPEQKRRRRQQNAENDAQNALAAVSPDVPAPSPDTGSADMPPAQPAPSPSAPQEKPPVAASGDSAPPAAPAAASWEWGEPDASPEREWTIMVYLDADNNLEAAGMDDFKEMERGFADGETSDVIVLVDRAKGFYTGLGDWTGTRAYRIKHNEDKESIGSELIADFGELDLGDGDTLSAFIAAAARKYPSRKTALVLWDHGMGWHGLANDYDTGKDDSAVIMPLEGLTDALEAAAPFLPGKKVDLLQFDMCLMGQAEVVAACAPYARYMVAGAPVVPAVGLDYSTYLPLFNAKKETSDIAADAVRAGCKGFTDSGATNSSLSAYDLSQSAQFVASWKKFTDRLAPLAEKYWTQITRTLYYSHNYGGMHDYRKGDGALASVDLMGWLARLKTQPCGQELRREIADLERTVSILMITTETGPALPYCTGLSFYAPLRTENYKKFYNITAFDSAVGWSKVLQAIYAAQAKDGMQTPKVTKVELGSPQKKASVRNPKGGADFTIKPAKELIPLSGGDMRGSYVKLTIDGKNILWAYSAFGVSEKIKGDYVIYHRQLLFDEAISESSQTTELNTPVFKDGRNELLYQYAGLVTMFHNGQDTALVTVDYTDISNLRNFTVEGVYSDSATGGEIPVEVLVDARFNVIVGITSSQQTDRGTVVRQITPQPDGVFSPTLSVVRGGKIVTEQGAKLQWKTGLRVINQMIPKGRYVAGFGMAESLGGVGAMMMSKPVKTADNPQIAPFVASTIKSKFEKLAGRYAVVAATPLRNGRGFVMAPNGSILEFATEKDDKGNDVAVAAMQNFSKGSAKVRFLLEPSGLPVIRLVVQDENGEFQPVKTDYAVMATDGGKIFWRLVDANDGSTTNLLPLDESWFPKNYLIGTWKGDDGSAIAFKMDPGLQALYAPNENKEEHFKGSCTVKDNILTITDAEGTAMTLFTSCSGDKLVLSFAESENCVIYTRFTGNGSGGSGGTPQPPVAQPPAQPQGGRLRACGEPMSTEINGCSALRETAMNRGSTASSSNRELTPLSATRSRARRARARRSETPSSSSTASARKC